MYFWRVGDLVKVLGERDLTEREAFRYFLANSILVAIVMEVPKEDWNTWDAVGAVATVIVTILGLIYCYRSNGGDAGQAFLSRVIAIMWVVTIRIFVASIPIALAILGVADLVGALTDDTSWWEALALLLLEVFIYARVAVHIRRVVELRRHWLQVDRPSIQLIEQHNPPA